MKKISYVLAALATIAIAAPAVAEDKPTTKGGMHEGMHHRMHGGMMETRRHYPRPHHHHMMKRKAM